MSDTESRSWNRFNSDFRIPDSDDAARVANEAKASIDTWVQNSLSQLEAQMTQRAKVQLDTFNQNIAATNTALQSIDGQIAALVAGLDKLAPNDPFLAQEIDKLKKQTQDARDAMRAAAEKWEQSGKDAVATAVSIAKTVATFV